MSSSLGACQAHIVDSSSEFPLQGSNLIRVEVRVSLKRGVLDAEGASTMRAMEILGFKDVRKVNVAKTFVLEFEGGEAVAKARAEEVCKVLLANPVIHDYRIEVVKKG